MKTKTRKPKRHDVTFLKKGDKVRVYNRITGKQLPGEYLVIDAHFDSAQRGMGGMDEGSPNTWYADLRKLRGNEYHPRARVMKLQYSTWGPDHKYEFEKVCKMKQVWVPV